MRERGDGFLYHDDLVYGVVVAQVSLKLELGEYMCGLKVATCSLIE